MDARTTLCLDDLDLPPPSFPDKVQPSMPETDRVRRPSVSALPSHEPKSLSPTDRGLNFLQPDEKRSPTETVGEREQFELPPSYPSLASTAIKVTIQKLHNLVSNAVVATEDSPQTKTAALEEKISKASVSPYVTAQVARLEEIIQAESRRPSKQSSLSTDSTTRRSSSGGSPILGRVSKIPQPCVPTHHIMAGLKSAPAAPLLSSGRGTPQPKTRTSDNSLEDAIQSATDSKVPAQAIQPEILVTDFAYPETPELAGALEGSLDKMSAKEVQTTPRPSMMVSTEGCKALSDPQQSLHRYNLQRRSSLFPPSLRLNGEPLVDDDKDVMEASNYLRPPKPGHEHHFSEVFGVGSRRESLQFAGPRYSKSVDLSRCGHVDLPGGASDYDNHQICHHSPVARNWPAARKRLTATVACMNLSCIGLILGLFAGEVPAIQYVIVDERRLMILGNVALYLGLAFAALVLWPLPILHGRKPYTIGGLSLTLCLQIPQGIAVGSQRLPNNTLWMCLLLISRAISGIALGLCDINVHATLLDVFGASLQSQHSHSETLDPYDARRHGGGMGLWLGIWSWCSIGPISLGFTIGAFIINNTDSVAWGFWLALLVLMVVLLSNIVTPEVRRSAFRRTLAEFRSPSRRFSRVARGEVKMHLDMEGPSWWGEEVLAGLRLCMAMLRQLGFLILSLYGAWVYAQFTLILMLLGALASQTYGFRAVNVGLCMLSLAIGALLATPFQKASWFSRARRRAPTSASMTLRTGLTWSSHIVRRTLSTFILPLAAIAYTFTSRGPPFPIAAPCVMAGLVGFFSTMALAECCGLTLETFDTSDLQPGMNGRLARQSVVQRCGDQRTNFSCYPRVSAGIALTQTFKYVLAAAATGVGGRVERRLGAMKAAGVVAGVLLGLTFMSTLVLFRWRKVELVPEVRFQDGQITRSSIWEPVALSKFSSRVRVISILEAGRMSRWWEIRHRNMLNTGLTGG